MGLLRNSYIKCIIFASGGVFIKDTLYENVKIAASGSVFITEFLYEKSEFSPGGSLGQSYGLWKVQADCFVRKVNQLSIPRISIL